MNINSSIIITSNDDFSEGDIVYLDNSLVVQIIGKVKSGLLDIEYEAIVLREE
jgi:hypothetical protein